MSSVMSAGRVEPGRFFSPLKFDRTSVPLTRSSTWFGNATSSFTNDETGSDAQNIMSLVRSRLGFSLANLKATSGASFILSSKLPLDASTAACCIREQAR